jgi:predicted nicotinamide N-methyase
MSKEASTTGSGFPKKAKARWAILRNALLHKARESSTEASIHRFPGYQLLKQQPLTNTKELRSKLQRVQLGLNSTQSNEEKAEITMLALGCLPASAQFSLELDGPIGDETTSLFIHTLQEKCGSAFQIEPQDSEDSLKLLVTQKRSPTSTLYKCCVYPLDDSVSLLTREPKETHLSLQDLVSHRTAGVDNTGNICVWDSERTLAYLLYQPEEMRVLVPQTTRRILELGTGMAGLAGVSLALRLAQQQTINEKLYVTLTDGHAEGVKNNKINQELTRAYTASHYDSLQVDTRVLLWTTDIQSDLPPQDVCLVSDCTHFQNFHSALAVTILRSLRVGGRALMCQPDRGGSSENFTDLLMCLKDPIVELAKTSFPLIKDMHEKSLEQFPDTYDEQTHMPRIFILTKLREPTQEDSQQFVTHQVARDCKLKK